VGGVLVVVMAKMVMSGVDRLLQRWLGGGPVEGSLEQPPTCKTEA